MALPYDVSDAFVYRFPPVGLAAAVPDGDDSRLWAPLFNGEIIGGWASYTTNVGTGTATVIVEIGSTDAITWTFTSGDTAKQDKAGTLSTTHTDCIFDNDDVLHLDITKSSGESERTINVALLILGR